MPTCVGPIFPKHKDRHFRRGGLFHKVSWFTLAKFRKALKCKGGRKKLADALGFGFNAKT